jgi:predicted component of type VI protein secretion system
MYGDLYRVLVQANETGLPHAFAERYNQAYEGARERDDPNQATASRRLGLR